MFIAISAYEVGQAVGAATILVLGLALTFKGVNLVRRPTPPLAAPVTVRPATQGPVASTGDDFFFAGPVTNASTTTGAPGNPTSGHLRSHADYSQPSTTSTSAHGWNAASLTLLIVGTLLAGVGAVGTYQRLWPSGHSIKIPSTLMGIARLDPNSDMGKAIDASWSQLREVPQFDADVQTGVYIRGGEVLVVAAAEAGDGDPSASQDFFAGLDSGVAGSELQFNLIAVEPGALGGDMQCTDKPVNQVSVCAWIDDDTFGVIVSSSPAIDALADGVEIRQAVER